MRNPSNEPPPADRPNVQDQIAVSVVGGQVRIHSLKQSRQALDPEARQVFAGSPAELADFFRDIQADVRAGSHASSEPADPAGRLTKA